MRAMFTLAAVGVLAAAAGCGRSDAQRLVGRWEVVDPPMSEKGTIEFTADGKVRATGDRGGRSVVEEGSYTLDGNRLTTAPPAGQGKAATATIVKLTDDELVVEGEGEKKAVTLRRVR